MHTYSFRTFFSVLATFLFVGGTLFAQDRDVTFIHISDQHYNKEKTEYPKSKKTVKTMNQIAGTPYPNGIGGRVAPPRGVLMTGDLTEGGHPTEWKTFQKYWGLTGNEGMLKIPVYEGAGNHDVGLAAKDGLVRKQIIKRNPKRPANLTTSENGLHYSWDWDDVHFVQLNEYAGLENTEFYPEINSNLRKHQRYGNPAEKSLQFLRKDLKHNVGQSNRPIVLLQHYGYDDFAFRPWNEDAAWWTEEHALRLWESIEGYNVIGILGGHNGSEDRFTWHGIPTQHLDDMVRFGVYRITNQNMTTAIYNSKSESWERTWASSSLIDSSRPPQLVQGPYLVPGETPGAMTICWRTNKNVPVKLKWGEVHFRYEAGSKTVTPYDKSNHLYKHTIDGLKRGTGINFTLEIDGKYAPGLFHTTKENQEKVSFLLADTPANIKPRTTVFQTMYDFIYRAPAYHSFILHPDHLVTDPTQLDAWDQQLFLRHEAASPVRYMLRRSPLVAPTGTTKPGRLMFPHQYSKVGSYTYERGPLTVAVLNTSAGLNPGRNGSGGFQARWLKHVLQNQSNEWQCVVWTKSDNPQANRQFKQNLQAICAEFGVELVIAGGDQFDREQNGPTTHITTGNMEGSERPGMLGAVKITGDTMTVNAVTPDAKMKKLFERKAN